ncbi:MAG: hypothetical protein IPP94_11885 [Ignavibacteria bacterium]|nr:hypothetical protein [Ignavibacteria bacterium]
MEPTLHSLAIGYARSVAADVHAGAALRYNSWTGDVQNVNFLLVSGGVTWTPTVFDRKLHLGISLMDFGDALVPSYPMLGDARDAPPAEFRIGLGLQLLNEDALTVPFMMDVSKPLEYSEGTKALSSFTALFRDWNDFPRDATLHTGIGFEWKPLDLCNDISFFQRIAFGNYSTGPKAGPYNVFTLSAQAGLAYKGLVAEAGVGAEWQHLPLESWHLPSRVPRELFEFTLRAPTGILQGDVQSIPPAHRLDRIVISAGSSWTLHVGEYDDTEFLLADGPSWQMDIAMYIDSRSALVASMDHEQLEAEWRDQDADGIEERTAIWRYAAQFRWHPFTSPSGLYVQCGAGASREVGNRVCVRQSTDRWEFRRIHLSSSRLLDSCFRHSDFVIEPQVEFSSFSIIYYLLRRRCISVHSTRRVSACDWGMR